MPNGDEYKHMETEADRILYRRYQDVSADVKETKDNIKTVHRRMDWILGLLIAVLGGVLYSLIGG